MCRMHISSTLWNGSISAIANIAQELYKFLERQMKELINYLFDQVRWMIKRMGEQKIKTAEERIFLVWSG